MFKSHTKHVLDGLLCAGREDLWNCLLPAFELPVTPYPWSTDPCKSVGLSYRFDPTQELWLNWSTPRSSFFAGSLSVVDYQLGIGPTFLNKPLKLTAATEERLHIREDVFGCTGGLHLVHDMDTLVSRSTLYQIPGTTQMES